MTDEFAINILEQYREKPTLINEIKTVEEAVWLDEALDMSIKALEQTRWIPVSERLPKRVDWYLTSIKWVDGTVRVTISWFDGMSFKAEVIAWRELPEPYKVESEDEE